MIESSTDFLPLWMLFSAVFGFMIGEACGDYSRHRKCLEQENEELRDRLQEAAADAKPVHRALREQHGVINDIHRRLLAVSKGLEKRPS
jgi:hypothetical protein